MTSTPSRDLASEDLWRSSQERALRRRAAARHRRGVRRITVPLAVTAIPVADERRSDHPLGAQAVAIAERRLGTPYRWGGCDPTGFDCSGLVVHVYGELGVELPHFAAAQYREGRHVGIDELRRGDLVFFDRLDHVGIYAGGGRFVHAPHTGDHVRISSLIGGWYADHYDGAVRIG